MKINYFFSTILFISTIITTVLSYYSWRRRKIMGASAFAGLLLAVSFYSFGYAFEILNSDINMIKFWLKVEYLGISFLPTWWILLGLQYNGYEQYLTKRTVLFLFIIPIITLLLHVTNDLHHLFYTDLTINDTGPFPLAQSIKGPWYWVHVIYVNLALFYGNSLYFVIFIRSVKLFRKQMGAMLLGGLVVWLGYIIYLSGNSPYNIDLNPFCFTISGIIFVWGTCKYKLLSLMPIALEKVFEGMHEGVVILDHQNHIIDFNHSAKHIIKELDKNKIGLTLQSVFADNQELLQNLEEPKKDKNPICIQNQEGTNYYNLVDSMIYNKRKTIIGRILLFIDITEQHKLMMQLNQYATIDELTQLYNRRYFLEVCKIEIERAKRYNRSAAFIIMDIDYFKKVNDTFGHVFGDTVLKIIADVCKKNIRSSDIIGRYGGEEFVILLPETSLEEAADTAERLRQKISNIDFNIQDTNVKITASFGVAELSLVSNESLFDFFEKADRALYLAKAKGRNKVILYQ